MQNEYKGKGLSIENQILHGHFLVTDPNSEYLHQTLKVQSGSYGHLGQQIGVCLEINEDLHTITFFWWQILEEKDYVITYNYAIQEHLKCKGLKTITYSFEERDNAYKQFARLERKPIIVKNLTANFPTF